MKKKHIPINRKMLNSLATNVKEFTLSEGTGKKAIGLFVLLILFLFGINALNVLNSYVGRDFMTAIEDRRRDEFMRMAVIYIGVFAVLTIVAAVYRFTEERLGLLWREWTTRQCLSSYANHRVYYRLQAGSEIGNPDQRIADDIRFFTITTLSFVLMVLNGSFTVIAFSGVMWSISPLLFVVAVLYAASGTFLTFLLGRPLVRLNYDQLDKEANFRASLIYLRSKAESVAASRREGLLIRMGLTNLNGLVDNFRRIISVNRNVNFFTSGYNWLIQILPALIIAPLFIEGQVKFGVITQAAIAFTQLLGAFSLIVTQFLSISSYTAALTRVASLMEAGEREKAETLSSPWFTLDENQVAFEDLTLSSSRSGRTLIDRLSLSIPHGTRVLIRGQDESARSALFHATAGLWEIKAGHIRRPPLDKILLVTELPYLPPATLRELLLGPLREEDLPIERSLMEIDFPEKNILEILHTLKIDSLISRFGGLDSPQQWENIISLDTQQLVVLARVLLSQPRFVFLEKPSTTLNPEQVSWILGTLTERSITYVTFEDEDCDADPDYYDALLELNGGGNWKNLPVAAKRIAKNIRVVAA